MRDYVFISTQTWHKLQGNRKEAKLKKTRLKKLTHSCVGSYIPPYIQWIIIKMVKFFFSSSTFKKKYFNEIFFKELTCGTSSNNAGNCSRTYHTWISLEQLKFWELSIINKGQLRPQEDGHISCSSIIKVE